MNKIDHKSIHILLKCSERCRLSATKYKMLHSHYSLIDFHMPNSHHSLFDFQVQKHYQAMAQA